MPTFCSFIDHNTSQRYQDADPEILGALGDLVKISIIVFFITNLEAKVSLCNGSFGFSQDWPWIIEIIISMNESRDHMKTKNLQLSHA